MQRASTKRDDRRRGAGADAAVETGHLETVTLGDGLCSNYQSETSLDRSRCSAQTAHPLLTPAQSSRWPSRGLDVVSTAGVGRTSIVFAGMYGETLSPGGGGTARA